MLSELEDGTYAVLLPLLDSGTFRATLRPPAVTDKQGRLVLRVESGDAAVVAEAWESE